MERCIIRAIAAPELEPRYDGSGVASAVPEAQSER